jgi:hypothetical protein
MRALQLHQERQRQRRQRRQQRQQRQQRQRQRQQPSLAEGAARGPRVEPSFGTDNRCTVLVVLGRCSEVSSFYETTQKLRVNRIPVSYLLYFQREKEFFKKS